MDIKNCKVTDSVKTHARSVIGVILIIVATLLTLVTFSGLGILAMFIVGAMLSCHHKWCCRGCNCGCCNETSEGSEGTCEATKKTTKKAK
jgi:hypothetical protein